ncbi:hypothetical protein [Halococcus sp. PRR34]|uniref:hypothetical protein n=1 Tax=Halococcus sp. PRR34 TaxID=3020830 RepID=UPI00235ED027|nr:hypothetical protein [Halococcus sp. PRR34]
MDRATGVAATTAIVYVLVMLLVGFWIFWGDLLLLGSIVFITAVLAPPCFFITRHAVRTQQPDPS